MNSNGGMTMRPILDKPDDATLDKIDFVIQGVENGLFKDLSKKIDFHQKLKGEESKRFLKSLIGVIEAQAQELNSLRSELGNERERGLNLDSRLIDLEDKVNNYNADMRGVANALLAISNPDPLKQGGMYLDEVAAQNFINSYKQKY
jgi:hypothetical protein